MSNRSTVAITLMVIIFLFVSAIISPTNSIENSNSVFPVFVTENGHSAMDSSTINGECVVEQGDACTSSTLAAVTGINNDTNGECVVEQGDTCTSSILATATNISNDTNGECVVEQGDTCTSSILAVAAGINNDINGECVVEQGDACTALVLS